MLPGNSIQQLVENQGPLDAATVFALAKGLLAVARSVSETYELKPNLSPSQIYVWRTAGTRWSLGFADYDLRPLAEDQEEPGELQLVQDLSLLFWFLGTRDLQTWFYPMLSAKYTRSQHPSVESPTHLTKSGTPLRLSLPSELLDLYQRLFDSDASRRPFSILDLTRLLNFGAEKVTGVPQLGEVPVERGFQAWTPRNGGFPEPYAAKKRSTEFGQPCTFEAVDRLRDTASVVHILPPDSATASAFIDDYRQSMQLAQGKTSKILTPVESVMCDPKFRVVAEKPIAAISISALLERKVDFDREEALLLLHKVDQALTELRDEGFRGSSLQLNDIYIKPHGAKSRRGVLVQKKFGWLSEPDKYQIHLRPFRSNLFYGETPDLAALNAPTGKFGRTAAITNLFRPEYAFTTLAYSLMTSAMESDGKAMPKTMADCFRKAFSTRSVDSPRGRERLLDRLRRTLDGKALDLETEPAPALVSAAAVAPAPVILAKPLPVSAPAPKPARRTSSGGRGQAWSTVFGAAALVAISAAAFYLTPDQQGISDSGASAPGSDGNESVEIRVNPVASGPLRVNEPEQIVMVEIKPVEPPEPVPAPAPAPAPAPPKIEVVVAAPEPIAEPPRPAPSPPVKILVQAKPDPKPNPTRNPGRVEFDPDYLAHLGQLPGIVEVADPGAIPEPLRQGPDRVVGRPDAPRPSGPAELSAGALESVAKPQIEALNIQPAFGPATLIAGADFEISAAGGPSIDLEKLPPSKADRAKMTASIEAIRKTRESGKIGKAAQQLLTAMEAHPDEPAVTAELDALIAGIRKNDGAFPESERVQIEELVQIAAMDEHRDAVSLLAAWSDRTDNPNSVDWNERAAEQGDPDAMTRLGIYYSVGKHVEPNVTESIRWFEQAAPLGQTDALYFLGECYFFGKGVEPDPAKAVNLLRQAHEKGNAKATEMLATCHAKGIGIAANLNSARSLYEEAISRGNIQAFGNLGVLYMKGQEGIDRNPAKAFSLFQRGANAGEPNAMVFYALCLETGEGTVADPAKARQWYVAAAKAGHGGAIKWCETKNVEF